MAVRFRWTYCRAEQEGARKGQQGQAAPKRCSPAAFHTTQAVLLYLQQACGLPTEALHLPSQPLQLGSAAQRAGVRERRASPALVPRCVRLLCRSGGGLHRLHRQSEGHCRVKAQRRGPSQSFNQSQKGAHGTKSTCLLPLPHPWRAALPAPAAALRARARLQQVGGLAAEEGQHLEHLGVQLALQCRH